LSLMLTAAIVLLAAILLVAACIAAILVAILMYVARLDAKMTLLLQHVGVRAELLGRVPRARGIGQGF